MRYDIRGLRHLLAIGESHVIGSMRSLTSSELRGIETAIQHLGPKRSVWRWSAKEDRKLILLIRKRGFSLRVKPFETNREVLEIAESMGRTYEAVHKRIQRLRKRMNCPNAQDGGEG
jgi:hypothetical protein